MVNICWILFTFVLYGVWFLLSKKKAVLNTPIHGFVSFPQINLICNYCAIVVLCIFTIFCEQENVCFSFNIPCHDMSQEASVSYYIVHVTNTCSRFLWRTNSSDTIKTKDPHSLPQRTFNKILRKITKIFSNVISDSIYVNIVFSLLHKFSCVLQ